ncbi:CCAAT-binding transcription factor (CBF-B/NF-YA) subunit B-domain-containing protein [Desarmillaria tabescens]|uniref:Transcriptional activator HAP2 n=1 Tax=Armillaria tabescens TaxID=1929756 RepID=A0AA39N9B2_ARMTA|nr:CCAAT-binding transcription factor (CBF-B/NF-YA) subunit B-domain-containing protein [Desarmillaria tabescens]KAK0461425.1 CCAAT-binding transcription factor (CBF-B/NF-YA) subunit B-domain-containing protein [Desarmillaria tabescens]
MSMEEHVVDQLFPASYPLQNWENSPPIDGALDTQIDGQLNPAPSLENSHGSNTVYPSFQHHITDSLEGGVDDEPLYVNAKQYFRILKRRVARARLDEVHRLSRQRKPYLHESRHKHAMRRPRGPGGRFLTAEEIAAQKAANGDDGAAEAGPSSATVDEDEDGDDGSPMQQDASPQLPPKPPPQQHQMAPPLARHQQQQQQQQVQQQQQQQAQQQQQQQAQQQQQQPPSHAHHHHSHSSSRMMSTNLHQPETETYMSPESMGMMNMPYGQTVQPMNMTMGQSQNKMAAPSSHTMYSQMRQAGGMGAAQGPSSITLTSPYPATVQMHHVPHPHAHARHRHSQLNYAQGLYAQLNTPMQPRSDEYNGGGN